MLQLDDVTYVVDENLLRVGAALVAVRKDTARFGRTPVGDMLPPGILDTDWIPIVGERGWVVITNDKHLRTRPVEAELAIAHKLKAIHLHGKVGKQSAWAQLTRIVTRWPAIEHHREKAPEGPWWLWVRRRPPWRRRARKRMSEMRRPSTRLMPGW
ncbi:PIN-like domain-containing protein [Mycobacterium persicum]|uniref:VapC45 PIN like domain-containing protein n=1 Tax=Mycobacterium persicum TaxID=1487726 RepID=A0AB38UM32_9MYCO|nr:hypothetical protein [Mycobacterium persicum]VAZ81698.1 hypothetical protein LAUMK42_00500 [Mycobacterium persicum]